MKHKFKSQQASPDLKVVASQDLQEVTASLDLLDKQEVLISLVLKAVASLALLEVLVSLDHKVCFCIYFFFILAFNPFLNQ